MKTNAPYEDVPISEREKVVNFDTHWPNRARKIFGPRAMMETPFSDLKELMGDRLRCRRPIARRSEV